MANRISSHTKRILCIETREIDRCALEGEGGVTAILVVLGLGVVENHWSFWLADDIPLGILHVLIEDDELTAGLLLDEVVEIHTGTAHDDHQVILAGSCDVSLLGRSGERWNVVGFE